MPMTHTPTLVVNAVLGAMAVTVGLWFLQGDLSSSVTIVIIVGLTILYAKVCPTAAHVWMWSTLLLGVESLAWPFQLIGGLEQYGAEPPIEEMCHTFEQHYPGWPDKGDAENSNFDAEVEDESANRAAKRGLS